MTVFNSKSGTTSIGLRTYFFIVVPFLRCTYLTVCATAQNNNITAHVYIPDNAACTLTVIQGARVTRNTLHVRCNAAPAQEVVHVKNRNYG